MELHIQTTVTYSNIINSQHRVVHNIGGTRSSKTYSSLQYCIVEALQEQTIVTVVRKTVPSLKRTIIKDFKDIMDGLGIWETKNWNSSDRIYTFSNGSMVQFVSTDDPQKLRGVKSDILLIDEANEVDEESFFQLKIRTSKKIILCYNPTISPYHWLRTMEDCDRYVTTYKDNPYLPKEMIEEIEALQYKNEKYYKIYALGEYAENDLLIYKWDTVDEIEDAELVAYGMDFGFSSDPTAMVAVYKSGDRIFVKEILYKKGLVTKDIVQIVNEMKIGQNELWCDSAEPRLIEELYRSGINAKPVQKGPDSIRFGISVIQNYKMSVLKSSTNLINELYGYEYAKDKYGYTTDTPTTAPDHLLDALRYVGMMRLGVKGESKGKYNIRIGIK